MNNLRWTRCCRKGTYSSALTTGAVGRRNLQDRQYSWGLVASIALHCGLGLVVVLLPDRRLAVPLPQQGIAVEILTRLQFEAAIDRPPPSPSHTARELAAPQPGPSAVKRPEARVPASPPAPKRPAPTAAEPPAMNRARRMLSAEVLADPRSADARAGLRRLASDERVLQLCNVEAMAQVHGWDTELEPDLLVAYATEEIRLSGLTIEADGGAVRSKQRWRRIRYRCQVTSDQSTVAAFEFLVGGEIPEEDWERFGLPAGAGPVD